MVLLHISTTVLAEEGAYFIGIIFKRKCLKRAPVHWLGNCPNKLHPCTDIGTGLAFDSTRPETPVTNALQAPEALVPYSLPIAAIPNAA